MGRSKKDLCKTGVSVITVGGPPGGGKTVIAEMLSEKYGLKNYDVGRDIFRPMADKRKMDLTTFLALCDKDPKLDKEADKKQKKLLTKKDITVVGRLSHFFAEEICPNRVCKIFLNVRPEIAAMRIFESLKNKKRNEGKGLTTVDKIADSLEFRWKSDIARYLRLYNLNIADKSKYDFVVNTDHMSLEEVFCLVGNVTGLSSRLVTAGN